MTKNEIERIRRGQVLAPEGREVGMPVGTPLGLGILGAARFAAIRRVFEQAERAAHAKAAYHDAEGGVAEALVRREIGREQLRHVDIICEDEANRIKHAFQAHEEEAQIASLRRELERMELEDQVAAVKARRAANRAPVENPALAPPADSIATFVNVLQRLPGATAAARAAREQIVREAGGEDKLSEGDRQTLETIDAMMQAIVSKEAEGKIL